MSENVVSSQPARNVVSVPCGTTIVLGTRQPVNLINAKNLQNVVSENNKLDIVVSGGVRIEMGEDYVRIIGDTMTGELIITPASGDTALTANKNIVIKAGQKLVMDGE